MSRWFNVDLYGNYNGGPPDTKKLVTGDNPEQLAEYAINNITDCYLRELGRHPRRMELELIWSRTLNKKTPVAFPRNPESEIL
jgi:hypothetical protein